MYLVLMGYLRVQGHLAVIRVFGIRSLGYKSLGQGCAVRCWHSGGINILGFGGNLIYRISRDSTFSIINTSRDVRPTAPGQRRRKTSYTSNHPHKTLRFSCSYLCFMKLLPCFCYTPPPLHSLMRSVCCLPAMQA